MAKILATINLMPEDIEVSLSDIKSKIKQAVERFGAQFGEIKEEDIAYGLKQLKLIIISDETKGLDPLEERLRKIKGIKNAEVVDIRRAIG